MVVSGIITSGGGCMVGERLSSSGTRLNVISSSPIQSTGPIDGVKSSVESVHRGLKSVSRQSLLGECVYGLLKKNCFHCHLSDLVSCKLGMSKSSRQQQQQQQQQSQQQRYHQQHYFSSSHDSISPAYINRAANVSSAASELDLSRKTRRKDLRGRLKLPASVALASSGEAPLLGSSWRTTGGPGSTAGINPPSSNHLNSTSSCNGTET